MPQSSLLAAPLLPPPALPLLLLLLVLLLLLLLLLLLFLHAVMLVLVLVLVLPLLMLLLLLKLLHNISRGVERAEVKVASKPLIKAQLRQHLLKAPLRNLLRLY